MTQPTHDVFRVGTPAVVWRAAGEEIIVLDTVNSVYFGLDRAGALLWTHLANGATAVDLVTALVAAEPVDQARATVDVTDFLDTLLGHGLIQRD
jgi:hypothetical protein